MNPQSLKSQEITTRMQLAQEYLDSAKRALLRGDRRLATDAAYNAAELVMKSAILSKQDDIPKRHGGVAQLFSLQFIKEGPLNRSYGSKIIKALDWRNKARYEGEIQITLKTAKQAIDLAESLLSEVQGLLVKDTNEVD